MKKQIRSWAATLTIAGAAAVTMAGAGPSAGDEAKGAVYVNANSAGTNYVLAFKRDPKTGTLTPNGKYDTGGMGDPNVGGFESHSVVSDGKHLYTVNPGSDSVSAFAINGDGSLHLLNVVPSSGRRPVSVAVHDDLLYVANSGNFPGGTPFELGSYSGFRVGGDGSLTALAGSTVQLNVGDSPGEILFNADGTRLVASRLGGNVIDSYKVNNRGLLDHAAPLTNQPGPFGATFSPTHQDQFFVGLANPDAGPPAPAVASYRLTGSAGPSLINAVTDANQEDPCWLTILGNGQHLWVSSFIPATLTLYTVASNGHITEVSDNTPQSVEGFSDVGSTDIALDSADHYLYRLRAFNVPDGTLPRVPAVEVLQVTGGTTNGGLNLVQQVNLDLSVFSIDLTQAGIMGMAVVDL